MADSIITRLKHAWNAFSNRDPTMSRTDIGMGYYGPQFIPRLTRGNERSIVNSIFNRIAIDVATINIRHVKVDKNGRYVNDVKSDLNNCLTLEANVDQTARSFVQDIVMSMLDEGCVAIVPVDTNIDPTKSDSASIYTMRTGKIVEWYPQHVKMEVYNDKTGKKEQITLPKSSVAIVENPLRSVINEPNSTMQRLIRKLNLLDAIDEQSSSGKLDLIIQLPYIVKTEARRKQAEDRRAEIERQLTNSKYGIAYTDGTEHITQLNRPVENNLMKQIEYLTSMLNSQLGITQSIMDGTANDTTMLNYYNRTVEPIISAITDEMKRKFLTKTARTQGQTIMFFRDPFKLVPIDKLAEIADKFTRNEIMSSNEIRQIVGMKPSEDPKADELRNKNLNQKVEEQPEGISNPENPENPSESSSQGKSESEVSERYSEANKQLDEAYQSATNELDEIDSELDNLEGSFDGPVKHYASEYYDPEKAHEYYEEHKKLKGRKSTSGLNEEGRIAAKYVRDNLNAEKKALIKQDSEKTKNTIDSNRENTNSAIKSFKEDTMGAVEAIKEQINEKISQHKDATDRAIDALRNQLKGLPKEARARMKDEVYEQIGSLRDDNRETRNALRETYNSAKSELMEAYNSERDELRSNMNEANNAARSDHKENTKNIKETYDQKYEEELEKIRNDPSMQKQKKAKRSKGSGKSKKNGGIIYF